MNNLRFSQMICSRLCHDLITPIGAVNTGLELLHENPNEDDKTQLLALSKQSAETASRRLVFYRAAFGFTAINQMNQTEILESFITGFLTPIKIQFTWFEKINNFDDIKAIVELSSFSRTLLNLVLMAAETAPFGGNLNLQTSLNEHDLTIILKMTGALVEMRPDVRLAMLNQLNDKQASPHNVQALMTQMLLEENQLNIAYLESSKSELCVEIKKNI